LVIFAKSGNRRQLPNRASKLCNVLHVRSRQKSLANAKGTRDSGACMKAHCPLGCSR